MSGRKKDLETRFFMRCSSNVYSIRKIQTSPQASGLLQISLQNHLMSNKDRQLAIDLRAAAKVRRSASRNGHAAHRQKCTFIKRKERKRLRGRRKNTEGERERERKQYTSNNGFVTPLEMLPSFVYHEKIPLMPQLHQTADQVHEWHLSEPRVNPMIRGNSPKGLCS